MAISLPTAVKDMPKFGGEPSEFLRWKNSIEIASSGFSDVLENPEKPEEEEAKKTWIKNNGTFYSVLYFLTKGEATGYLYPYRAKRGEHRGDGVCYTLRVVAKLLLAELLFAYSQSSYSPSHYSSCTE